MKLKVPAVHTNVILSALLKIKPDLNLDSLERLANHPLIVEISRVRGLHTEAQRKHYWALLHELGLSLGYTARESEIVLHNHMLCEAFGTDHTLKFRNVSWPVPRVRSRDLDTAQYSQLIDVLERVAAENGVGIDA